MWVEVWVVQATTSGAGGVLPARSVELVKLVFLLGEREGRWIVEGLGMVLGAVRVREWGCPKRSFAIQLWLVWTIGSRVCTGSR